jgi:hypothetical protein
VSTGIFPTRTLVSYILAYSPVTFFLILNRCEYELQRCFLGNELDSTFDEGIEKWDSLCGNYVTFTPTTPAASAFTDHPDQLCQEVKSACQTAGNLLDECSTYKYDLDTSSFSSCTCQPRLLRQEYSCLYIGNASCLVTEVALSNLPGYSQCDNFPSVIGTGLVSRTCLTNRWLNRY